MKVDLDKSVISTLIVVVEIALIIWMATGGADGLYKEGIRPAKIYMGNIFLFCFGQIIIGFIGAVGFLISYGLKLWLKWVRD